MRSKGKVETKGLKGHEIEYFLSKERLLPFYPFSNQLLVNVCGTHRILSTCNELSQGMRIFTMKKGVSLIMIPEVILWRFSHE